MPLTKLFQKRHSLNEASVAKLANEEIEKLKSSFESSKSLSESQPECVLEDEMKFSDSKQRTSESENFNGKYEYLEKDCDGKNNSEAVFRRNSAPPTMLQKLDVGKPRSVSCQQKSSTDRTTRRKKCVSESNAHDTTIEERKTVERLVRSNENPLENVLGRYMTHLIRESIITAVKSANVESICEENLDNSESSNLMKVETEKRCETIEEKALQLEMGCIEYMKREHEAIQKFIKDIQPLDETASLDGYADDFEEYVSLYSTDLEEEEARVENQKVTNSDSGNHALEADLTSKCLLSEKEKSESESSSHKPVEEDILNVHIESGSCKKQDNSGSSKLECEKSHESGSSILADSTDLKIIVNNVCPGEKPSPNKQLDTTTDDTSKTEQLENTKQLESTSGDELNVGKAENTVDEELNIQPPEITKQLENTTDDELNTGPLENTKQLENTTDDELNTAQLENSKQLFENTTDDELNTGIESEDSDLILISPEKDAVLLPSSEPECPGTKDSAIDLGELLPRKSESIEEEKKHNWKVGYLHVKLPHKTRSKGNLKAWKKRCISIQPDEFVNDPKNPSLMISVYSAESGSARKHGASFWKSISCQKAVVYRSSSRTHKYAFTISDDNKAVVHLAGESEATSQDWMSALRAILWPPSPVVQLEKMLYGKEFEVSIIDNDFSFRAGLLGMYGYLTITRKKLILVHPQQGFVIQEWYLNTIDKFELVHQTRIEDVHKILSMTTCSDSSTGKGEILLYCVESIAMLQAIASTLHQILTEHTKQGSGKYEKELSEMADWLVPAGNHIDKTVSEDYYKVPPRQVKSLLDIPNFIFNKPLVVTDSESCSADENVAKIKPLEATKDNPSRASQDSGISTGNVSEDFLNCSTASFIVGGGNIPGKSSDSELSDSYTPPRSPEKLKRKVNEKINKNTSLNVPS